MVPNIVSLVKLYVRAKGYVFSFCIGPIQQYKYFPYNSHIAIIICYHVPPILSSESLSGENHVLVIFVLPYLLQGWAHNNC